MFLCGNEINDFLFFYSILKQDFIKVVPASIASETVCFVFYDNHPCSEKSLDLTLCTSEGEIIELHNRDIISSLLLEHNLKPSKIAIHRIKEGSLHYIVQAKQKLFIIQSDNQLRLVKKLENVESFDLRDDLSTGTAVLQLKCSDDALPIVLDDNFQIIHDTSDQLPNSCNDESSPIVVELKSKLKSTQYSVSHNENILKEQKDLRYNVAFKNFQEMHNGGGDAVCKSDLKSVSDVLKINISSPWIKLYGNNIVIILDVFHENDLDLTDIQILLQSSNKTLTYQTKLYESSESVPYWSEIESKCKIKCDKRTSLVLCMEMEDLKEHLETNIDIGGFILYKLDDQEKMLPFESVKISTLNVFRNELSLLSKELDKHDVLAVLASSAKTELVFRHIKQSMADENIDFIDILCDSLGLEPVLCKSKRMLLHKSSPYHVFHGLLIVFKELKDVGIRMEASVYYRTHNQILALIHAIHDLVPHKIIITTSNHNVVPKNTTLQLKDDKEDLNGTPNIKGYASSLIKQMDIIKENYDNCIVKMNESKDEQVRAVIGERIDLMACGSRSYEEFKLNLESEIELGVKCLNERVKNDSLDNSNSMFMDTDGY